MKPQILYWVSTLFLAAILLWSAATYFFHSATIEGVKQLGFPDFFRIQLGTLKLIAALVLLIPSVPFWSKEWAYAGTALFFLTAVVAHCAHGDSPAISLLLALFFGVLIISRIHLPQ